MLQRHKQFRVQIQKGLDMFLFATAFWLAHLWRSHWKIQIFGGEPEIHGFENYFWLYLFILPLSPLILQWQGFYDRPLLATRTQILFPLLRTCILAVLAVIAVIFLFRGGALIARSVVILFGIIAFLLVLIKEEIVRWAIETEFGKAQFKKRVILVGTKEDTQKLRSDFQINGPEGLEIVEEIDLNERTVEDLIEAVHQHSVNGVILNARHTLFGKVEKTIQACELEGVEAWLVADFFKTQVSRTTLDEFYGRPVLVFRSAPETAWPAFCKQVFDLVGAAILLLLTSPLLIASGLIIKFSSPGPILFRQLRSGLNGKPFMMYKFRSMVTNAEQRKHELAALNEMSGPVFKVSNDPRITPIGRWIRRYSIDELPQLINVLRGEMSLVGPRPLPVDEVARFDHLAHRRRLSVKPGLTCLWQVSGRNNVSDFRDWVRLDLEYIDNWSLWLDLKILWRTIPVVLMAKGAR